MDLQGNFILKSCQNHACQVKKYLCAQTQHVCSGADKVVLVY